MLYQILVSRKLTSPRNRDQGAPKCMDPGERGLRRSRRYIGKLSLDVGYDLSYRFEVIWNHILIRHGDGKTILKKGDKFEDTGRVNHVIQQRLIVAQCFVPAKEVVIYKKGSDFPFNICSLHGLNRLRDRSP
jgi:hypothetical protein